MSSRATGPAALARSLLVALMVGTPTALLLALVTSVFVPLTTLNSKRVPLAWSGVPAITDAWATEQRVGFGVREVHGESNSMRYGPDGSLEYWDGSSWRLHYLMPNFEPQRFDLLRVEAGFPFPALESTVVKSEPYWQKGASSEAAALAGHAQFSWRSATAASMIPLRPIAMGLLLDALIIGAAFLLVRALLRLARSMVRVRCGRCGGCGYRRGQWTICPECGRSMPSA